MSRQTEWMARKRAAGLCQRCGRGKLFTRIYCKPCRDRVNAQQRQRMGFTPWEPGKPGRPPKE